VDCYWAAVDCIVDSGLDCYWAAVDCIVDSGLDCYWAAVDCIVDSGLHYSLVADCTVDYFGLAQD